jgi:hypothetical protein
MLSKRLTFIKFISLFYGNHTISGFTDAHLISQKLLIP